MAVPSLKSQRAADVDRIYETDLPWVEMVSVSGVSGDVPARFEYPDEDQEKAPLQRDLCWCRVRREDWGAPAYRDTVTVTETGFVWRVALVVPAGPYEWRLKLEANVRMGMGR